MREPRALNPFRLKKKKKKKKRKYDERKRNAYHWGVSPALMKKQLARPDSGVFSLCTRTFGALKNEAFFKSIGLVKTLNSKMEIFKGLFINKKASGVYAYF